MIHVTIIGAGLGDMKFPRGHHGQDSSAPIGEAKPSPPPGDSEAALARDEAAMVPRGDAAAVGAHQMLELCLDDRAPLGLIDFFTTTLEARTP